MAINWPVTPAVGATVEGPRGEVWKWDGVKWVSVVGPGGGGGANVSTGVVPPVNPNVGDLWFDPVEGQMYIWFNDGTSSQWVVTINQSGGGGGAGGPQMGVTDGSNAAAGQVGEYLETQSMLNSYFMIPESAVTTTVFSLTLPPGDWDVSTFILAHITYYTNGKSVDLVYSLGGGGIQLAAGGLNCFVPAGVGGAHWLTRDHGPVRSSSATAQTVVTALGFAFSDGSGMDGTRLQLMSGVLRARRVR